ncbi:hypothetical protein HOR96_gp07 [Agrobacterium phage Atu_ph02]|uniref:Uncharacterized protein n=1 Tax=Agrobacterium phage Atu_ph02 TaxID=2024261 RepID=A0A2L0UYW3_9CAUD|nr:hypothetical protein HOR96_gp07 [Agrobacterium phage Atu_ph02]AUZ94732.1 hypothetical protein [Agrobacterium phage Atu_ph02]
MTSSKDGHVPVQGLLAELANQHTQTPKAVVKLQPQPLALDGKQSSVLMSGGTSAQRAAYRMGHRDDA